LKAVADISKGDQCYDSYGVKTNYEALLFYGMVIPDNLKNNVTYEMLDIPTRLRKNLNYKHFRNTVEFELCGSYSRGTMEIFSFIRFLACANASADDCPSSLNGFECKPISIQNEQNVCKVLNSIFIDIYNKKIVEYKNVDGKVEDFAATEVNILVHWISILKGAIEVLGNTTFKGAKKAINNLKPNDYINWVVRRLVSDKKSYIK